MLAQYVGPVARVLIERAAATSAKRDPLIAALAAEIEDEAARSAFVAECRWLTPAAFPGTQIERFLALGAASADRLR